MGSRPQVILLPGVVLPADLAYGALLEALGDEVEAVAKDLEIYAGEEPPPNYALDVEIEGILRFADASGFDRFHLVGYSGGGASSLAFAAKHPERLRSLALLEPAWAGNEALDPAEQAAGGRVGLGQQLDHGDAEGGSDRLRPPWSFVAASGERLLHWHSPARPVRA
jgi:pimeloyl-ACP methyl ester carboxylesterase